MQINPATICSAVTKVFQYGKDFAKHTAYFLREMTGSFIEQALGKGYNIVVEGTFRMPESSIKTLKDMQQRGYQTVVYLQTAPSEVSW
nr:zeta toxin family protein [uncultured Neisseria sp.]